MSLKGSDLEARWGPNARFNEEVGGLEVVALSDPQGDWSSGTVLLELSENLTSEPDVGRIEMVRCAAMELAMLVRQGIVYVARRRVMRESVFLSFSSEEEICVLVDGSEICLGYSTGGHIATFETFVRFEAAEAEQFSEALFQAQAATNGPPKS
jgi:hypothetical protein